MILMEYLILKAGKKYTQLNFLIGYLVAQNPQRPVWNFGDIFAGK